MQRTTRFAGDPKWDSFGLVLKKENDLMKISPTFRFYQSTDLDTCLQLFDRNCPLAFAPNERPEYQQFLQAETQSCYELCLNQGTVVGAFGLLPIAAVHQAAIRWIMLDPQVQRLHLGTTMMEHILANALHQNIQIIQIAASQVSQPFFAKFGAQIVREIKDGWGPDMHRLDMELKPKTD